jgi:cell wall assembly regulator SMI1
MGAKEGVLRLLEDPRVWSDRRVHDCHGASRETLDGFESRTDLPLPSSLRDWLSICNGARNGAAGCFGLEQDVDWMDMEAFLTRWSNWVFKGWIPVAKDETGNPYMIGTRKSEEPEGYVFFVDSHESDDDPSFVVASDIWHFLRGYLSDALGESWWPFDQEAVLSRDPSILRAGSLRLPWDT